MEEKNILVPRGLIAELSSLYISKEITSDTMLKLSIAVDDKDINLRDFTAYLELLDTTYGRLTPRGISSYSQSLQEQLTISKFRHGSLQLQFLLKLIDPHLAAGLILAYLVLRYVPVAFERFATAYSKYEEGRLLRERRKALRRKIEDDSELSPLSHHHKNTLIIIIDGLFVRSRRLLPKATRFADKQVRDIKIEVISTPRKENSKSMKK